MPSNTVTVQGLGVILAILHVAPEAIMIGVRSLFEMSGGW